MIVAMTAQLERTLQVAAISLALACLPARASGCAAPVFRYVLERWPADTCELVLLHRGPLAVPAMEQMQLFQARCVDPNAPLNVVVRRADVGAPLGAGLASAWQELKGKPLPWAVLLYPDPAAGRGLTPPADPANPAPPPRPAPPVAPGLPKEHRNGRIAWSGPAIPELVSGVLDSPARQEIARRLLGGESAVWVFLESGKAERDGPAVDLLTKQLSNLTKELKLPPDNPGPPSNPALEVKTAVPLRVSFSVLRVRRDDPAENAFVTMLENAMAPPLPAGEPHAFVAFGKGRFMDGVAEAGLTPQAIRGTCEFLLRNCSCIIKDHLQRVSFHVPMAANWQRIDRPAVQQDLTVPALAITAAAPPVAISPAATLPPVTNPAPRAVTAKPAAEPLRATPRLSLALVWTGLGVVALVAVLTWLVMRKPR